MNYKLKEEAKKYFDEWLHDEEKTVESWGNHYGITESALEPVEGVRVEAHGTGWDGPSGCVVLLTFKVLGLEYREYLSLNHNQLATIIQAHLINTLKNDHHR